MALGHCDHCGKPYTAWGGETTAGLCHCTRGEPATPRLIPETEEKLEEGTADRGEDALAGAGRYPMRHTGE